MLLHINYRHLFISIFHLIGKLYWLKKRAAQNGTFLIWYELTCFNGGSISLKTPQLLSLIHYGDCCKFLKMVSLNSYLKLKESKFKTNLINFFLKYTKVPPGSKFIAFKTNSVNKDKLCSDLIEWVPRTLWLHIDPALGKYNECLDLTSSPSMHEWNWMSFSN